MKLIAKIISAIFNPVFVPVISLVYILYAHTLFNFTLPFEAKRAIILVVFIFSCLLPLITIYLIHKIGLTEHLNIPTQKDRRLPIIISAFYYFLAYILLRSVTTSQGVLPQLPFFLLAGFVTVCITFAFNFFTKISIHMVTIGGFLGIVAGYGVEFNPFAWVSAMLIVICAALVAFARLQLNVHTPWQVVLGFFTGFLGNFITLFLFV